MPFTNFPRGVKSAVGFSGPIGTGTGATPAALSVTTLTASGAATLNGAVTLGDAAGDAITVTGTMTVAPLLTASGGVSGVIGATGPAAGFHTTLSATTSFTLGAGTALTGAVVYSQTITPASVAAATVAEQTFTVTGLTTADKVFVNHAATGNATGIAGVRVSAANTLAVSFVNPTAGALVPGAGTWNIMALRS